MFGISFKLFYNNWIVTVLLIGEGSGTYTEINKVKHDFAQSTNWKYWSYYLILHNYTWKNEHCNLNEYQWMIKVQFSYIYWWWNQERRMLKYYDRSSLKVLSSYRNCRWTKSLFVKEKILMDVESSNYSM